MVLLEDQLHELIRIIDLSYRCNGVGSMMGPDQKRLRVIIGYTTDSHISLHLLQVAGELTPKGSILYIMDGPVKSVLSVYCQPCASGSQMGMIVGSIEQIKHAIFL